MATAFDAVWTGATDNAWTTVTNWSPANVPTTTERILIPAGTPSITCVGMSDVDYTSIYIAPGYTGTIGSSANRLTSSFVDLIHKGSGKIWVSEGASTSTRWVIDAPGNIDAADITGAATNLFVIRGGVTLNGASSWTLIVVGRRDSQAGDATLTISGTGGTQATVIQYGGRVTNTSTVTLANINAGEWIQQVGSAITTANVGGAGNARLEYQSNTTMTTCSVFGNGILDVQRNRTAIVTITTLYQFPGSALLEDAQLLTVTNRFDYR
jgi:hypothetical protein